MMALFISRVGMDSVAFLLNSLSFNRYFSMSEAFVTSTLDGGEYLARLFSTGAPWILEKYSGMVWIGLMWLRIGTSGGLL
jgi:hypothetical protein